MIENEIKKIVSNWRPQVISFIKEKDKLENPDKYVAQNEKRNSSAVNMNLFDDFFDEDEIDSSDSEDSGEMSPIIQRKDQRQSNDLTLTGPPESSFEASLNQPGTSAERQMTLAEAREKLIDDELTRYGNISRTEFSEFCSQRGLTRSNRLIFESVGAITWEWWRSKKQEFPIIFAAIKFVLQAPTSSSAVERMFSRVSAYTANQKNRFKSKNLMALLQIAEMDTFSRLSADIFTQNGIKINSDVEIEPHSLESADDSDSSDIEDFDELFSVQM